MPGKSIDNFNLAAASGTANAPYRLAAERLGITPDEIPGCHCVALSHPKELADLLVSYTVG